MASLAVDPGRGAAAESGRATVVTFVPALGGVLTIGMVRPWAETPGRYRADRVRIDRISHDECRRRDGRAVRAGLATSWAVVATELVFLAWGLALATWGYHLATRCPACSASELRSI